MKSSILSILKKSDSGYDRKKLRIHVIHDVSGAGSSNGSSPNDYEDDKVNDKSAKISKEYKMLFDSALDKLIEKGKVVDEGDHISLSRNNTKISSINKKERDNDSNYSNNNATSAKDENVEEHRCEKKNSKRSRNEEGVKAEDETTTVVTSSSIAASKAFSKDKYKELWRTGEQMWRDGTVDDDYLARNPDNITRLFVGNLKKTVTEDDLHNCLEGITYIKWITDKQSGEFYGSTFIEMKDPNFAIGAVLKDKQKFLGRPLKIYYCPPRPGDVWPPKNRDGSTMGANKGGGSSTGGSGPPRRERTQKPPACKKLYMGNLSYNIDDDTICDFFKECGEIVGLRWLTRQGSEEFRGGGFIEFDCTEAADKAIKLDGVELLGRPIKLDYTE